MTMKRRHTVILVEAAAAKDNVDRVGQALICWERWCRSRSRAIAVDECHPLFPQLMGAPNSRVGDAVSRCTDELFADVRPEFWAYRLRCGRRPGGCGRRGWQRSRRCGTLTLLVDGLPAYRLLSPAFRLTAPEQLAHQICDLLASVSVDKICHLTITGLCVTATERQIQLHAGALHEHPLHAGFVVALHENPNMQSTKQRKRHPKRKRRREASYPIPSKASYPRAKSTVLARCWQRRATKGAEMATDDVKEWINIS